MSDALAIELGLREMPCEKEFQFPADYKGYAITHKHFADFKVQSGTAAEFADVLGRWPGKTVVDLVRQWKEVDYAGRYEGLSWGDINANRPCQESSFEHDFRQTEF